MKRYFLIESDHYAALLTMIKKSDFFVVKTSLLQKMMFSLENILNYIGYSKKMRPKNQ